jgi:hypothetical protein
MIHTK